MEITLFLTLNTHWSIAIYFDTGPKVALLDSGGGPINPQCHEIVG